MVDSRKNNTTTTNEFLSTIFTHKIPHSMSKFHEIQTLHTLNRGKMKLFCQKSPIYLLEMRFSVNEKKRTLSACQLVSIQKDSTMCQMHLHTYREQRVQHTQTQHTLTVNRLHLTDTKYMQTHRQPTCVCEHWRTHSYNTKADKVWLG